MRKIKIGEKELGLKASPLALFYYQKEFGTDLMNDLMSLQNMADIDEDNLAGFDSVKLLQIIYAMNKANNFKKEFPNFEDWLNDLEYIDLGEPEFMVEAMEEATAGFFRSLEAEYQEKAAEVKEQIAEQKSK